MENSSKLLSRIYSGFENVILGVFASLVVGNYIIVACIIVIEKSLLPLLYKRVGYIYFDVVGNIILY